MGDILPSDRNASGLFTCPICGYPELERPPYNSHGSPDFDICPCCGLEFGYDDADGDHAGLRAAWVRDGMTWWAEDPPAPAGWDPSAQLKNAGF